MSNHKLEESLASQVLQIEPQIKDSPVTKGEGENSNNVLPTSTGQQALNIVDMVDGRLPILRFKDQILKSVQDNPVTIITAETGAGKSTQVPIFLSELGYKVIVTQPRRLAARTLASRVAQEVKSPLGEKVGFHTSDQKVSSSKTEILFCTDGLQMIRELTSSNHKSGGGTVLVLDEVHEWNINMEVLIAWVKKRIESGEKLKVVIMSATLDGQKLSQFYGQNTASVEVPGRLYPVEKHAVPAREIISQIAKLAEQKRNILVFQTGKAEIEKTIQTLKASVGDTVHILPLHGDLTPAEQQECFKSAPKGKSKIIVSTNVAQTSVTIPDIDAVVDCGQEKSSETRDGISGLYIKEISQADCAQRAGRAGRTKPGVYVLCSDLSFDQRSQYPIPEIMRSRLDEMVLRLAEQSFDAAEMNFFHQPNNKEINSAKKSLVALGALDSDGKISSIGRRLSRLPLTVKYGRMLIEAEKYGVLDEVATIAACLEVGDIRSKKDYEWKRYTKETRSDLLAILDVYNAAQNIKAHSGVSKAEALRESGIFAKDFFRAQEVRQKLLHEIRSRFNTRKESLKDSQEKRKAILISCLSGLVDHLYSSNGYGYHDDGSVTREKCRETVVIGQPEMVVALPLDLQTKNRRGQIITLNLINMVTQVDADLLRQAAPHLVSNRVRDELRYDPAKDVMEVTEELFFQSTKIGSTQKAVIGHPKASSTLASWMVGGYGVENAALAEVIRHNNQVERQAREYNRKARKEVVPGRSASREFYEQKLAGAKSVSEIKDFESLKLPTLSEDELSELQRLYPDTFNVAGHSFEIAYGQDCAVLSIDSELLLLGLWKKLPDEGFTIPSGEKLFISTYIPAHGYVRTSDIIDLKKILDKASKLHALQKWLSENNPNLTCPSPDSAEMEVPFEQHLIEAGQDIGSICVYGTCDIRANYYGDGVDVTKRWFVDKAEAESVWSNSVEVLADIRQKMRDKQAYQQMQNKSYELNETLSTLYYKLLGIGVDGDLMLEVSDCLARGGLDTMADLQSHIEQLGSLLSRLQVAEIEFNTRQKILAEEREALSAKYDQMASLFGVTALEISRIIDLVDFIEKKLGVHNAFTVIDNINQAPYGRSRRQADLLEILKGSEFEGHYLLYTSKAYELNPGLDLIAKMLEYRKMSSKIAATAARPESKTTKSVPVEKTVSTSAPAKPVTAAALASFKDMFNKKR